MHVSGLPTFKQQLPSHHQRPPTSPYSSHRNNPQLIPLYHKSIQCITASPRASQTKNPLRIDLIFVHTTAHIKAAAMTANNKAYVLVRNGFNNASVPIHRGTLSSMNLSRAATVRECQMGWPKTSETRGNTSLLRV